MDERRTKLQKIILALLAAMAILFGILTAVSRTQRGAYFEGTLLRQEAPAPDRTVYTGKVHGTPVTITVDRESETRTTVEFLIKGVLDDVCVVESPLAPVRTEHGHTADGVRITKNGDLLFEGGYNPEDTFGWYGLDGAHDMDGFVTVRPGTSDPWNGFKVDRSDAMRFALEPELEARGSWGMYFAMLLFTFFVALDVAFPMSMFYLQHCCDVRNPEPSDFYLACQRAGWVLLPPALLAGYCCALRIIP